MGKCNIFLFFSSSGSGKTTLLAQMLDNWQQCTNAKTIARFTLVYTQYQPIFDDMTESIKRQNPQVLVEHYNRPPPDMESLYRASVDLDSVSLLVFDDCQGIIENAKHPLYNTIMDIFRVKVHHNRIVIIVILQVYNKTGAR